MRKETREALLHALNVGALAFGLAIVCGLLSQTIVEDIAILAVAVIVLLAVILIGIAFDIVGVAVAAAREEPLHASAANRVFGAHEAVTLVRNAHQVASFCNDVVGDVAGTLGGAIGIAIVYHVTREAPDLVSLWATILMTAVIAALVVGGKAVGKLFAIRYGTQIVFQVGRLIAAVHRVVPFRLPYTRRRNNNHYTRGHKP